MAGAGLQGDHPGRPVTDHRRPGRRLFTLPSAAIAGALAYWLAHGIGGSLGVIILLAILTGLSGAIYVRSRATKVDHNVNDQWPGGVAPSEPEPAAAG